MYIFGPFQFHICILLYILKSLMGILQFIFIYVTENFNMFYTLSNAICFKRYATSTTHCKIIIFYHEHEIKLL